MRSLTSLCHAGSRFFLGCALSFLVWGVWTLLGLALCMQLWIALSHRITLPDPLLRLAERHLSQPGFSVKLGSVSFDPSGHLVVRNYAAIMDSFKEPILQGTLLHTRLDPWGLLAGDPKTRQLELSGLRLLLPAPLSPTGKSEACVENLDAVFSYDKNELVIVALSAKSRAIALAARGSVRIEPFRNRASDTTTLEEKVRKVLGGLRRYVLFYPRLDNVAGMRIDLLLVPSDSRGAIAELTVSLDSLNLPESAKGVVGPLLASARIPVVGDSPVMTRLDLRAGSLSCPFVEAKDILASLRGIYRPDAFSFEPREADLSAGSAIARGIEALGLNLRLEPAPLPRLHFDLAANLDGAFVAAQGSANTEEGSAQIGFRALPSNASIALAGKLMGRDLGKFITLQQPARVMGDLSLSPGWKISRATGWIEADSMVIHRVPVDRVQGAVSWDGDRLVATNATLWQGDHFARGSYEMSAKTRDFRFLLEGRLRPMAISGWFKAWWPNFWANFDFSKAPPEANADVRGRWGKPGSSIVYVGADTRNSVIRGAAFDRAWAQVLVLAYSVHVPYMHGVRREGEARGWFSRINSLGSGSWDRIQFDVKGNVFPHDVAKIFDPYGSEIVRPFWFAEAPSLHVKGRLEGPAGTLIPKQEVDVELVSKGAFKLFDFPVEDVSSSARWVDRKLDVPHFEARYAQGAVAGHAKLDMEPEVKQIDFEGTLKNAKLSEASSIANQYWDQRAGRPPAKHTGPDKLAEAKLDLAVTAKGRYDNPLSFHGSGQATVASGELGQVKMFGLLSELLRFTTLRFTSAKTQFTIEGPQLVFPSLRIAGRNSAIEGHGRYSLEHRTLDFNAKVWPFDQSQGLVQEAMKLVLSPFSHVFEVRLEGTLADPRWSFVNNPFRTHTPQEVPSTGQNPETPPASPSGTEKPQPLPSNETSPQK